MLKLLLYSDRKNNFEYRVPFSVFVENRTLFCKHPFPTTIINSNIIIFKTNRIFKTIKILKLNKDEKLN